MGAFYDQFQQIEKKFPGNYSMYLDSHSITKGSKMMTMGQLAHQLGVKHWCIRHLIEAEYIDRPPEFAGNFLFTNEIIDTIKTFFQRKENDYGERLATDLETLFA